MQAFIPFAIVPVLVGGGYWLAPWVSGLMTKPAESIVTARISIPPGIRDLRATERHQEVTPIRLAALMPSDAVDRFVPPPEAENTRQANERLRLRSVLVTPDKRAAVIDNDLVFEGNLVKGYRVQRIADDRVILLGAQGREVLRLDGEGQGRLTLLPPKRRADTGVPAQPPLSSDELERQYRRLLDRL